MAPLSGTRSHRRAAAAALVLLLCGKAAAASPPEPRCAARREDGSCAAGSTSSPSLVQKRTAVHHGVAAASSGEAFYHGSGCTARVGGGSSHPAACIVVKDNRALLVNVYYGKSPGWDLPGGWHHDGEAPCETAEREVCEETGMSVRVVAKLTGNVFQCEVTGHHVCTKPVDEGFLQHRYFSKEQLWGLKLRGGSWGDKRGLLRRALAPSVPRGTADACGCRSGIDGWSSTTQQCAATSQTSPIEAIECQRKHGSADFDVCGCRKGMQGWSTTSNSCSSTSKTSPSEAAACSRMTAGDSIEED